MKFLLTSGATREPIDSVRFITNVSSGKTGVKLAQTLEKRGHEVWLLRGTGSEKPQGNIKSAAFNDFAGLNELLMKTLGEERFDVVIHLAAVSDFSVESVKVGEEVHTGHLPGKLDSGQGVEIRLKRNFKIVDRLKLYNKTSSQIKVVAFKLTSGASTEDRLRAVAKLYESRQVDLVVHNDLDEIHSDKHLFRIVSREGKIQEYSSTENLAEGLVRTIGGKP
jgi:phosphopantothenoylcysteine decarboxylase/phosphopantothenate--cysteine ligase